MARKTLLAAALLGCAAQPVLAQMQTNSHRGEFTLGVSQTDSDTLSSKFLEYRDIPNGLFAPHFRFQGEKNALRYDVWGINVRQKDQAFKGFVEGDKLRLEAYYNQIPHSFGNDGRTLLENTSEGVWQLSDTIQRSFQTTLEATNPRSQVNYAFLNTLVSPSLQAANRVDLRLERERGNLTLTFKPDPVDVRLSYFRERRVGSRAASGTSFGFGNVVELPEALHYLTQDFGADAAINESWGSVRAGAHYNWFQNRIEAFAFDNPFRVTDSTDPNAYQAPGSASVNGPRFGLMALPPENTAAIGTAGTTLKLGKKSRLIADVSLASWRQDKTPFLPYTTNSAVLGENFDGSTFNPTVASTLPAQKLEGKADVTSFNATFTSRPSKLFFTARYRFYDLDNKTEELRFPGYVRFDGVWEEIGRKSVPYGFKTQSFDAVVGYDLGGATLEVGYKGNTMDRTFREAEKTRQNGFTANLSLHGSDWVTLRAGYEFAARDYEGLDIERSEEESFLVPGAPVNLYAIPNNPANSAIYASLCGTGPVCNLRYDQAKKDTSRLSALVDISPGSGKLTFSLAYIYLNEDYEESRFGLTQAKFNTFNAEASYAATDRANLYAFYSYEDILNDLRGRQSGATVSANPLDDWTSNVKDKVHSFGAGGDFTLKPEKWSLNVMGRWQSVDGNNALAASPGGAPANARAALGGVQSLPRYDDTKLLTLNAEVRYQLAKAWTATLGGFFEDYQIRDANTQGLLNYVPGSFFLAYDDGDYRAKVGYVRLTYRW